MITALMLALSLAAIRPERATNVDVQAGAALAASRCGGCHATGRTGASRMRTAPPFRDLHKRYPVEGLAEALAEGIGVGNPVMREHVLEAGEIDQLIAYLKSLETKPR